MFTLNNLRNKNTKQTSFLINFSYDGADNENQPKKDVVIRKKSRNVETNILDNGNVNIVSNNGNKYVFNNGQEYITPYTINSLGKYKLTGIPSSHPIAILNSGKESLIDYSVINDTPILIKVSGGSFGYPYYQFTDEDGIGLNIATGQFRFMRGKTYRFVDNGIFTWHPFSLYASGISDNSKFKLDGGSYDGSSYFDITIPETQSTLPGTLYYQCKSHGFMKADMKLLNRDVNETGESGNGLKYDFYYGDVTLTVLGDFENVSVYCYNHGYMGGKNIFKYDVQPLFTGPFIKYNTETGEKEIVQPPSVGEVGYDPRLDRSTDQYDRKYNPYTDKENALYNASKDPTSEYYAGDEAIPGNDNFNVNVWMNAVDGSKMELSTYGKVSSNLVQSVSDIKTLSLTDPKTAASNFTDLRIKNRDGFSGLIASSSGFNNPTFQNNIADKARDSADTTKFDTDIYAVAGSSVLAGTLNSTKIEGINTAISIGTSEFEKEGVSSNGAVAVLSNSLITINELDKGVETKVGKYASETLSAIETLAKLTKKSEDTGKQFAIDNLKAIEDVVNSENILLISNKDTDATSVDIANAVNKLGSTAVGIVAGKSAAMGVSAAITSLEKLKETIHKTPTQKDKQAALDKLSPEVKKWVDEGLIPLYSKNEDSDEFTALVIGPTDKEKDDAKSSLSEEQKEQLDNGKANLIMKWNSEKKKFEGDGIKVIPESNDNGEGSNDEKPNDEDNGNETKNISRWTPSWIRNENNFVPQNFINTRLASNSVKAEVLVKYEQLASVLNSTVIDGLLKDTATTNSIMEDMLTSSVRVLSHPELSLVKNYSGDINQYKGVKRAVLIGINYASNDNLDTLSGCINDAMAIRGILMDTYQYKNENITVLRDDLKAGYTAPTRENIIQSVKNAVSSNTDEDELWIHYSGHGSLVTDEDKDETDKRDEGIFSSDYDNDAIKIILDDELKLLLNKVKGTVMITQDCCNSGTGWDLPYKYTKQSNGAYERTVESTKFSPTTTDNIYMLSGSRDDQLAVETGERLGAFTEALIESLRLRNHTVTFFNLESAINDYLKNQNLEQRTVFTSANYSVATAGITRSMITSSNVPPYRV